MSSKVRLESLDVLRGFDLFLLVALHPILIGIDSVCNSEIIDNILYQFDHESWVGFRLWDIVMPLFLFITGSAIPFSMDQYKNQPKKSIYIQIVRRFIILWILGMVIQGNLLGLDWKSIKLFSNTLQAIAIGYLVTSFLYLNFNIRVLYIIAAGLIVVYSLPFIIDANFSEQHNFAISLDKQLLKSFMDGVYWDESENWHFSNSYNYSWIWSSLTFSVSVMIGCFAGKYIKDNKNKNLERVAFVLLIWGVGLIVLGLAFSLSIPIIKRVWTSSMTLFSSGINLVLLASFFYLIDVKKWNLGNQFFKVFGMNSIIAYFIGEFLNFRPIIHQFTYGLEDMFPEAQILILNFGNVLLIFGILWLLYRNQKFIKI